jgi:hypothetical protein
MQIFTLIPLEIKLSICFLVVLPAIMVGILRFSLYSKIQEMNIRIGRLLSIGEIEGMQPPIVDRLKKRYEKASKMLEHVNTLALIDNIYKEEKISYGNISIQFDRAESITRILPNLLIAFGLIGTFLGITNNLTDISTIVTNFNDGNIEGLVQGLQKPLQAMGIAFSASLFGIMFGSILTVINTFCNTSIAKYQMISGLEDYLDNIYKPTVEGNTRLDKAVDKMVTAQNEFLTRFHENVGVTLERTFGKAANQIAVECGRINKIAENVYTNFSNSAGTISIGATTFQQAANLLENQTKILSNSLSDFKSGAESFSIAANKIEQNNIIQNIDRVLVELSISQQAFSSSTKILENSLERIIISNVSAAQLAEKVYQNLNTFTARMDTASATIDNSANTFSSATTLMETHIQSFVDFTPRIQQSAVTFEESANKLVQNNIVQNIDRVLTEINISQQKFSNSTKILENTLVGITDGNQKSSLLAHEIYQTWQISTNKIDIASGIINDGARLFQQAASSLQGQTQALVSLAPQFHNGVSTFASAADLVKELQSTQANFTKSTAIFSQSVNQIQPVVANLEPAISAINKSTIILQQVGGEMVNLHRSTLQNQRTQNVDTSVHREIS